MCDLDELKLKSGQRNLLYPPLDWVHVENNLRNQRSILKKTFEKPSFHSVILKLHRHKAKKTIAQERE